MSAKIIVLGSSNSIPDESHENTHLLVVGEERVVLIDCAGSPILRLKKAGVEASQLTDLILTHFHPDHVSGVPILLMNMWLMGCKQPLRIYGLAHTIDRIEEMMGLYDWKSWPGFFQVNFFRLPASEMTSVIDDSEMKISASPVKHLIPTIGLRIDFHTSKKTFAYSCDTEPCPQVVRLALQADVLVHEATGPFLGHSSAGQAGEIAQQAGANLLILIHYPTDGSSRASLISEAQQNFSGKVRLAEDYLVIDF
jgi:ribonuclease Z